MPRRFAIALTVLVPTLSSARPICSPTLD